MKKHGWIKIYLIFVLAFFLPVGVVNAQETQTGGQIYIVQPGDTLSGIAARFGVTVDDLIRVNGITDPDHLVVGTRLIIPGPEMIRGEVITQPVAYGETLRSLSRRYRVPVDDLILLNRLASPAELYAGSVLVIPKDKVETPAGGRATLLAGQSLLELAVIEGTDPWSLVATNALSGTWDILPGDVLRLPGDVADGPGALPAPITAVELKPSPSVQGKAVVIQVTAVSDLKLGGTLAGYRLHFFPDEAGKFVALQGIYAKQQPGLYPLTITGTLTGGASFEFSQMIVVQDGNYLWEDVNGVPETTLDPTVTRPEDEEWAALASPATPERMWNGEFEYPVPIPHNDCFPFDPTDPYYCWISLFGSRRSYNGGPRDFYHSGLDMYAGVGTEIHAVAPGVVVFAGWLDVRGNATMIDHGWGVYTAYLHQSELEVKAGDRVDTGQVIGLVGGTGRAGGPHLHFEILVGDVPVNPLDWLQQAYP